MTYNKLLLTFLQTIRPPLSRLVFYKPRSPPMSVISNSKPYLTNKYVPLGPSIIILFNKVLMPCSNRATHYIANINVIRNRMGDNTLDALITMQQFYQKPKKPVKLKVMMNKKPMSTC